MKIIYDIKNPYDKDGHTFGSIRLDDGRIVHLKQDAYLSGANEHPYYAAAAEGEDGVKYEVTWQITDASAEDAADACDWDDFSLREI